MALPTLRTLTNEDGGSYPVATNTDYDHPQLQEAVLARIAAQLRDFPGYARILRVKLIREPWSVTNGFMTPTMKLCRNRILAHHAKDVDHLYLGHEI